MDDEFVIEEVPADAREDGLVERLAGVWERSVRATHSFLAESDIVGMRPLVRAELAGIPQLAVAFQGGIPVGFAGASQGKLEMLFVDDGFRGKGAGAALLDNAVAHWDAHRLDVNEQNPQARGFYEHKGFRVVARSARDGQGNAFPLLHMERAEGIRALMGSGAWFDSSDAVLARDRAQVRDALSRLNAAGSLGEEARVAALRDVLGSLGSGSVVSPGAWFDYGYRTFIGDDCFLNFNCVFLDGAPIVLEDGVQVGPGCVFATPLHPLRASLRRARRVRQGAWLASNVTVNPGVTIGAGAVIGSGSVVTRDIPDGMLAVGNPCRVVRAVSDADDADLIALRAKS